MAPSNDTTSTPPKLVVTLSSNHSTLQWHPTIPQQWHHVLCTLVTRPIRQSGSSPSPPFGSKNPHSYRYLGNNIYLLVFFIELETLKVTEVLTYHHVIRHFGHLPSLASIEARASLPNLCDLDLVGFVPTESPLTRHETRVKTLRSGTCRRNGEPRIVSKIWHRNCKKKWSLLLAMRGIRLF